MLDFTKMVSDGASGGGDGGAPGGGYRGLLQGAGVPPLDRQSMLAGLMMGLGQAFANQGRMRPMQAISNAVGSVASAGRDDPARLGQMMQAGQQMRELQRRNLTREWLVRNADRLGLRADAIDKLDDAEIAEIFMQVVRPSGRGMPGEAPTAGVPGSAPRVGPARSAAPPPMPSGAGAANLDPRWYSGPAYAGILDRDGEFG